jgi:hypothetical protein
VRADRDGTWARIRDLLRRPTVFALLIAAVFFGLGLAATLRHEMWRDELESWLVGKDSPSLAAVWQTAQYTSLPAFWKSCLYLLCRVTTAPAAMQIFHLLIATVTAFVTVRWSPFSRLQRVLLVFGYFFFYEYALISRNYAFAALSLVAFCAAFGTRRRTYLVLAVFLFLLSQTAVHGLIVAVALAGGLVLEARCDRSLRASLRRRKLDTIGSALIAAAGFALCVIQIVPPADSGYVPPWRTSLDVAHAEQTVATIWRSYVPVPAPKRQFWGTNIVRSLRWRAVLSVCVFGLGAVCLVRRPIVLAVFVAGTGGLLLFSYMKFLGYLRHHGFLYLLLVACLWLSQEAPRAGGRRWRWHGAYRTAVLFILFSLQLVAALIAVGTDWRHPFSASEAAAEFILAEDLNELTIVGDRDYAMQGISARLSLPIYYPVSRRFGTFVVWNDQRRYPADPLAAANVALEMSAEQQQDVLVVVNYELSGYDYPVVELAHFGDTIVVDERFWIYLVKCNADAAPR